MEDYVGRVCPYCRTTFAPEDEIAICPICGTPHHVECWMESGGCVNYCTEEEQDDWEIEEINEVPLALCRRCGAVLEPGETHCATCGTAQMSQASQEAQDTFTKEASVCVYCGAQLQSGQLFCPLCGKKIGEAHQQGEIKQNKSLVGKVVDQIKGLGGKKRMLFVLIPCILAVVILGGILIVANKKAEENRDDYEYECRQFLTLTAEAGANLEDIANTVAQYWHENIFDDLHGYDIEDAVENALSDMLPEIIVARGYDSRLEDKYSYLKNIPEKVPEDDLYYIRELNDAVKDLYNAYEDYYSLAMDPSGNYTGYISKKSNLTDEYLACYHELEDLLD